MWHQGQTRSDQTSTRTRTASVVSITSSHGLPWFGGLGLGGKARGRLFQARRGCESMRILPASTTALLAVGLALAGCLGAEGPADGVDGLLPGAGVTSTWTSVLAGPGGDAESSLAVSPD